MMKWKLSLKKVPVFPSIWEFFSHIPCVSSETVSTFLPKCVLKTCEEFVEMSNKTSQQPSHPSASCWPFQGRRVSEWERHSFLCPNSSPEQKLWAGYSQAIEELRGRSEARDKRLLIRKHSDQPSLFLPVNHSPEERSKWKKWVTFW